MAVQFDIGWEAADLITLKNLKEQYKMAKEQLDKYYNGEQWLHRDDLEHQSVLMFHLKAVIEYYGGSVD